MPTLVRYDQETGEPVHIAIVPAGHDPEDNQLLTDLTPETVERMMVDTSADPPELVENPDYDPRSELERRLDELVNDQPVRQKKVAEEDKQAFRDARDAGDIQGQLDALFEIVTGETP